ncbi:tetratricopeptide repeat-containing diguanylate cyclase [Catenuloplanes atrovinosus]|uniref:Diguanylate cyclase (GGDEF)-like protein n=1 Tax=Catenuloplanes atrovinosus TaxID=137266 RepID=A0AAE3YRY6_9ACTN|nr:GGDEF domain-containing protein [Catenuloplanes atrovinosus]MDR7277532.1 diguanylate cyclase (GGDEF)-like protein [Catenuloplanes atrovinosus]
MTIGAEARRTGDPRDTLAAVLDAHESRSVGDPHAILGPAIEARRLAEELGDEESARRAILLHADVLLRDGRLAEGGRMAQQVLAWAEQHDRPFLRARAHRELALFHRLVGEFSDALAHAVQCVAGLEDATPGTRAQHLMMLAVSLDDNGRFADSDRYYRTVLEIASDVRDRSLTLRVLNNMAYNAYETGDESGAIALAELMRQAGARFGQPLAAKERDTIARVEMMGGRYAAVEETLAGALAGALPDHDGDGIAECLLTLAEARRRDGRFEDAQAALDHAVARCDANGHAGVRAQARQEQAALHAAAGRYREAYEEHRIFHAESTALYRERQQARAFALQALFEADEARRATEHFREMAHRDALTGLYNRRYVDERLPALLAEVADGGGPLSVAIVDLDHFKRINDTLSHATGDTVLQQVARLLEEAAEAGGFAARLGGEEFVLVMPGTPAAAAVTRAERLRRRVRAHAWAPLTGVLPVTTSVGVATTADGHATMAALLAAADRHLYAAKHAGRDRVVAARTSFG